MSEGLTRDEDTALRCLDALAKYGPLSEEHKALLSELVVRDRRTEIRNDGAAIPSQRTPLET